MLYSTAKIKSSLHEEELFSLHADRPPAHGYACAHVCPQAMRERAAAYGVAPGHWDELANGEHAFIAHGAVRCGEQPYI